MKVTCGVTIRNNSAYISTTTSEEWPEFLSLVLEKCSGGPVEAHVSFDYSRLSLGPVQRVLARANAAAVLETSDCRGRKFFRERPPLVMHIHEYSNVIERRASVGVERDGGVLERFDQPSTRFKNDEGRPRERIQIRAAQGPQLLRRRAEPRRRNTEGRARALYANPPRRHARHRFLSRRRDIAPPRKKYGDGLLV